MNNSTITTARQSTKAAAPKSHGHRQDKLASM